MGAKKAESELGNFDCVYTEHGKAPSVGKLTVFKTSLVFKAEMFGRGGRPGGWVMGDWRGGWDVPPYTHARI